MKSGIYAPVLLSLLMDVSWGAAVSVSPNPRIFSTHYSGIGQLDVPMDGNCRDLKKEEKL